MANTKLPARLLDTSAIPALNVTGDLTVDTTTLKVDSTNNRVGIGIASPSAPLHVGDEAYFDAGTRHYTYDDQANFWSLYTNTDDSFRFNYNGAGADEVVIDSSGNVGIGTTSPSYKLDVDGVIRGQQYLRLKDTAGTNRFAIQAESTYVTQSVGALVQNFVANYYRFYDDALSEMMRIADNGNVGIGTEIPSAKLEVEQSNSSTNTVFLSNSYNNKGFRTGHSGFATFSGYQDSNNTTSGSAYGALIGLNTFYNGTNFYNDNQYIAPSSVLFKDGNILFHTNDISAVGNFVPSERLRITKAGDVGIGTTNPDGLLHIDGMTDSKAAIVVEAAGLVERLEVALRQAASLRGEIAPQPPHLLV